MRVEAAKAPGAAPAGSTHVGRPRARPRRKIKTLSNLSNHPSFSELGVAEPLCRVLAARNYDNPTPIQARAIPLLLQGRDIVGVAQTGTGKTAAFALPILQLLGTPGGRRGPRALILAPTRELAIQIADGFKAYGANTKLRLAVIFGGVSQRGQVEKLRRGVDIIVATPGRLLDLMNQGHVALRGIEYLVLDEAGLHPRRPQDHRGAPAPAAVVAVFRHHAGGGDAPLQRYPLQARPHRHRAQGGHALLGPPKRPFRRHGGQIRPPAQPDGRQGLFARNRVHPDQASRQQGRG